MGETILKATGLCKDYGKKSVLHDVNFTVNKGDIYGLVGKNGAGKTTIMRIITGLQLATSGEVEYGFERGRLGSVGALVELPSIYANKSAYENIKFQYLNLGLRTDGSIMELLKLVGLDNTGNKPAGKFSLGMRQRLGIAMAMVGDPEVLVLDEPINGLDPQGIIGVRDLLLRLNRDKGMTIIISSHILSELSKLATRYAFIDNGRIIRECTEDEIEHAGEKLTVITTDRPADLNAILLSRDYKSETVTYPDKVTIHGNIDITDIVLLAKAEEITISDLKTVETNLEEFYVGIVGGNHNA